MIAPHDGNLPKIKKKKLKKKEGNRIVVILVSLVL
jgi:hypothetical protein